MSKLIAYPHGLGDCILLTPVLREYFFATGKKMSVATLERFKSAKFFDNNPYVDKILYTKDAWNDYSSFEEGCWEINNLCLKFAKENNIEEVNFPRHKSHTLKIISNYIDVGFKNAVNPSTEIYTTTEEVDDAIKIIDSIVGDNSFGFIQTNTGVPAKDLPEGYGRKWLNNKFNLKNFIEVGKEIDGLSMTIGTQFEIMRRASRVCLPDSVFYHACGAINKPVDFVYFAKGKSVYERVRPLHPVSQNIVYELEKNEVNT